MFLTDDEINEFHLKNNEEINNAVINPKRPVCHFFVPKVETKWKKVEDRSTFFHNKNNSDGRTVLIADMDFCATQKMNKIKDGSIEISNVFSVSHGQSVIGDTIIKEDDMRSSVSNEKLSLISQPMNNHSFASDCIKREFECPRLLDSSHSSTITFSLNQTNTPSASKSNSDLFLADDDIDSHNLSIKDVYSVTVKSPKNIDFTNLDFPNIINKSDPLPAQISSLSPSIDALTSSSGSIFHSSIKLENDATSSNRDLALSDRNHPSSPLATCSYSSSLFSEQTFQVDIDKEPSRQSKSTNVTQPIVLIERLISNNFRKRKATTPCSQTSTLSSDSDSKRSKRVYLSNEKIYDKMRKFLRRDRESDEETEPAIDDRELPFPENLFELDNRTIVNRLPKNLSVDSDLIFCFQCNTESKSFCKEHPIEKIGNVNIDCPFVEYLTEESSNKFIGNSSVVFECSCKQNELDHIQQSLPFQFHLRESRVNEIGVWTKVDLKRGSLIGPYLGEVIEQQEVSELNTSRYKTRRFKSDYFSPCIEFAFKSNWLRCINFATSLNEANLKVVHYDRTVFFQVIRNIKANDELLLFNKLESNPAKNDVNVKDVTNVCDGFDLSLSLESDYTVLSEQDIENIPFQGTKYCKEMIVDIAKIWHDHPQLTIGQTLKIISDKYPESTTLSERYMSKLSRKYQLRHRGGANVKFDSQMIEFVRLLLLKFPRMSATVVNRKLKERFPLRMYLLDSQLNKLILQLNLRPPIEIPNAKKTIKSQGFDSVRNKDEMVANIRQILKKDPLKSVFQITADLKRMNPLDMRLDAEVVKKMMRENYLPVNFGFVKKIDEEMKQTIYQLRKENPQFSAATINQHLRRLLPDKPYVQQNAIYLVLRKFNFTRYDDE